MTKALNRRTVLRGLLATGTAVTIPLPLLDAMLNENGNALAQSGVAIPTNYLTWFFGNGVLPGRWNPAKTGKGAEWALSDQLQPLADFKSHLTVISGLANKLPNAVPHPAGSAASTTGGPLKSSSAQLPSIDQIVADVIAKGAPRRSLEIGVTPATPNGSENTLHAVSHTGPNAPKKPEFDPKTVFSRLFTGTTSTPTTGGATDQAAKLAKVRGSVLDSVLADGAALKAKLGAADQRRLEQHLDGIRAIENRLKTMPTNTTASCTSPTSPTLGKDTKSEAPPAVNTAMVDLTALAFACDQTRVISYVFTLPAAHVYYRHLAADMNDDFHDTICHTDAGTNTTQTRVHTGVMYTMKCLNELLTKFKNTPHGASNLLDNSLIYVTSCTSWGKTHTATEWPVLLAGKGNGALAGDQHLRFPGENLSKVLFTIAKIFGSTKTEIGMDAGKVTAELSGVRV